MLAGLFVEGQWEFNKDDPKFKQWKEKKEYEQYCQETSGKDESNFSEA